MKETAEQSAELKSRFKDHFRDVGLNAPLPPELAAERDAFPDEWGEAYHEFETQGWPEDA